MGRERKIIRLREYDYRQSGAYAITLCVHERRMAFGVVVDGAVRLNPYGRLALGCWMAIPDHFSQVILDEVVVMPNHLHGILFIEGEAPPTSEEAIHLRQFGKPQGGSLGTVIGAYKSAVTKRIGEQRGARTRVWQERFFDHVIRNDDDLVYQRRYIQNNPSRWTDDEFYSAGP
jgi:putative transposase